MYWKRYSLRWEYLRQLKPKSRKLKFIREVCKAVNHLRPLVDETWADVIRSDPCQTLVLHKRRAGRCGELAQRHENAAGFGSVHVGGVGGCITLGLIRRGQHFWQRVCVCAGGVDGTGRSGVWGRAGGKLKAAREHCASTPSKPVLMGLLAVP